MLTNEYNRYSKEYVTVKIPRELLTQCEILVENSKLGFTSRTDVIKNALRDFLIKNNNGVGGNGGTSQKQGNPSSDQTKEVETKCVEQ